MSSCVPRPPAPAHGLEWPELQAINEVEGLANILQLVLQFTGLKFAAIGKLSDEHWAAYIINDEMHLGLKPGCVIPAEVALCNKILKDHTELVLPWASQDPVYKNHPSIINFGLDSYVSLPIFLSNGELFGSLCATAPYAAQTLSDSKTLDTLRLLSRLSGQLLSKNPEHLNFTDARLAAKTALPCGCEQ